MNEFEILEASPEEFNVIAWKHFDCSEVLFLNADFRNDFAQAFEVVPKSYLVKSGEIYLGGIFGYKSRKSFITGRFLRGNVLLINPNFIKKNLVLDKQLREGLTYLISHLKKSYEDIVFENSFKNIDLRGISKKFQVEIKYTIILTPENCDNTWLSDSVKKKIKRNLKPLLFSNDLSPEEKVKPVSALLEKKIISKHEADCLKTLLLNSKALIFQKSEAGILVSYQEHDGRCINLFNWDDPNSKDNPTLLQYYGNIQLLEQGVKTIDRGGANMLSISNFKESFGGELKATLKFSYKNREKKMKDFLDRAVKKITRNS